MEFIPELLRLLDKSPIGVAIAILIVIIYYYFMRNRKEEKVLPLSDYIDQISVTYIPVGSLRCPEEGALVSTFKAEVEKYANSRYEKVTLGLDLRQCTKLNSRAESEIASIMNHIRERSGKLEFVLYTGIHERFAQYLKGLLSEYPAHNIRIIEGVDYADTSGRR